MDFGRHSAKLVSLSDVGWGYWGGASFRITTSGPIARNGNEPMKRKQAALWKARPQTLPDNVLVKLETRVT